MAPFRCECKAVLTQRKAGKATILKLEEPVKRENVKIGGEDNRIILTLGALQVEVESEQKACEEAENKTKEFAELFSIVLLLKFKVASYVDYVSCTCTEEGGGGNRVTYMQSQPSATATIEYTKLPSKKDIENAIKVVKDAYERGRLDDKTRRFLKWYRDGLVEEDHRDMFIKWWIAFEIWYTSRGYKEAQEESQEECRKETGEARAAIKALQEICDVDDGTAKNVYRLRSALFHVGVDRIKKMDLDEALKILSNCVNKIRDELWKKLSHEGS